MRKSILISGIIISIIIVLIFYFYNRNNFIRDDKQNFQITNNEFEIKVNNKDSEDLFRNILISQKNNLHGKDINSKFSFIVLLEKDGNIHFKDPKNYNINYKIILNKNDKKKYKYEILSQYFEVRKDYANREFFNFNGEFEIKDIL